METQQNLEEMNKFSHKSISVTNSRAPKLSLNRAIVNNEDCKTGSKYCRIPIMLSLKLYKHKPGEDKAQIVQYHALHCDRKILHPCINYKTNARSDKRRRGLTVENVGVPSILFRLRTHTKSCKWNT